MTLNSSVNGPATSCLGCDSNACVHYLDGDDDGDDLRAKYRAEVVSAYLKYRYV